MDNKVIMRDSPEAASLQTVSGWVSRHGRFFGSDESIARYDGCTHVACSRCGAATEKRWTACTECRSQNSNPRWYCYHAGFQDRVSHYINHNVTTNLVPQSG